MKILKRIAALFRQMLYDFVILQLLYLFHISLLGIQRMNLHTPPKCGPLMEVELKNNIIVHWRPHGVPLRFGQIMPITDLHYISNDIDEIAGGPHAVIVFTFVTHLVFHPITFYVYEVAKIRQSVVALLSRAPQTTVIIKSGNTAGVKVHLLTFQPSCILNSLKCCVVGMVFVVHESLQCWGIWTEIS